MCGTGVPLGPPLCNVCHGLLPLIPYPRCGRCGAPDTSTSHDGRCVTCDAWPEPLDAAASAVLHAPPADTLVAGLKYRGWTALVPPMAALMVEPARGLVRRVEMRDGGRGPLLVPVPLDPRRRRRRGFNQARLLAEGIGAETGWPVAAGGLRRRRTPRRQAELSRAERLTNVRAAFRWDGDTRVPGQPMILVDDVLTTGATAAACWAAIRDAGGHCGGVVTFARSLPRFEGA